MTDVLVTGLTATKLKGASHLTPNGEPRAMPGKQRQPSPEF